VLCRSRRRSRRAPGGRRQGLTGDYRGRFQPVGLVHELGGEQLSRLIPRSTQPDPPRISGWIRDLYTWERFVGIVT
jgi:hypothetical protein